MTRVNYMMTALQPIFTGSDEDTGTIRTFRREKVILVNPVEGMSWYKTENERRAAILSVLEAAWCVIDFEGMGAGRKMKIWDEFSSKVLAATGVRTRFQFVNELCHAFNIRSLRDLGVTDILQRFGDDEFLQTIRDELQFLILLLRKKRKDAKEDEAYHTFDLFEVSDQKTEMLSLTFRKTFDWIPVISGNSIRGILRRLAMRDFCKRVGIAKLDKTMYHQLFTGGTITDSTKYEDIERREAYIAACPMIGLFGSAIGNMTIEGEVKVGAARPLCREHSTGDQSFWELLNVEFATRRDDSKLETEIEITGKSEDDPTIQMKYGYEVLTRGTRLQHSFVCTSEDSLIQSAFWHLLGLFRDRPFIGGSSAVGNGEISVDYEIPDGAEDAYLAYLESHREQIQEYFGGSNS